MRPVVCRRADQHAVVVARKTLDLHQCLTSAVRARAEIRVLDGSPVKGGDDVLRARGLKMFRAPAKVHDLLWVARCEIRGAANMSRISRAAGIAAPQCIRDAAIVDRSGVTAL